MGRFLLVSDLEAWFLIDKLEAGDGRALGAVLVQSVLEVTKGISRVSPFDEQLCGTSWPQLRLLKLKPAAIAAYS